MNSMSHHFFSGPRLSIDHYTGIRFGKLGYLHFKMAYFLRLSDNILDRKRCNLLLGRTDVYRMDRLLAVI